MENFVGSRTLQISDEMTGLSFPAWVVYPTQTPPVPTMIGRNSLEVSPDAPLAEGQFPLVLISHGSGGSHLAYHTIALHLARQGYIVAMPEHPGNNRNNNDLNGTLENLVNRPRHLALTIDAVASDGQFNGRVQAERVGVIGHSMGAYTALAIAGGTPWTETRQQVEVVRDGRVKALVLMAPATGWYLPEGSLDEVAVPILMLVAERDPLTPLWQAELVLDGVPDRSQVTWRMIENAGHFSFLSPFPAEMKSASFPPSMDPAGFDREKFHRELGEELRQFLDLRLKRS